MIYKTDNDQKKADEAAQRSLTVAKRLVAQYPDDVTGPTAVSV